MAGNFPDALGVKFAYDVDGSVGFVVNSVGVITLATASQLINGNDETLAASASEWPGVAGVCKMGVIFPQLRDLAGYMMGIWNVSGTGAGGTPRDDVGTSTFAIETSADTTNGNDGVWTNRGTPTRPAAYTSVMRTTHRTGVTTLAVSGIKAVRFAMNYQFGPIPEWSMVHFYGTIPAASTPDRLTLWHPTLDQELGAAGLDFGDVLRSTTTDKTFRVKNRSATLTANVITLAMAAPTDTTPTYLSQYTISTGGAFASTGTIATLAPGAISAVCTLRLITTASAGLSTWRQRLSATATTWS